jgi:ABC-type dipeptide/oligopeptide/nickel transport system permease subunit
MTTAQLTPGNLSAEIEVKYAGFWVGAWRRFRRNYLAMYGLFFVVFIVAVALLAPILSPYPYLEVNLDHAVEAPSSAHWLGTDQLGRDMLTRIMYGARPMLLVGVLTQIVAVLIGVPLGIVAGYMGGPLDWVVTRLVDFFSALPWYLVVLYLVMLLKPSLENLIIALAITSWVFPCRIVRGLTLSVREQEYVDAARALGIPTSRILFYHVLPQALPLLLWSFAVGIPTSVFAEAGLSFIGMGIRPPEPSWGQMLGESGQWWIYRPHMFVYPGLMIALSVLAFQGLADGLRSAIDVNVNI